MRKIALVIGGNGVLGNSLCSNLNNNGWTVLSIIKSRATGTNKSIIEFESDRTDYSKFCMLLEDLKNKYHYFDLVVDLIPFSYTDSKIIGQIFATCSEHIFIISTTLVYDILDDSLDKTELSKLSKIGVQGGYVDKKLGVEKYWNESLADNWTILRPYHILGKGSLLGCFPIHNRDSKIIDTLLKVRPIYLAHLGERYISFIDPDDISNVIISMQGNRKSYREHYNIAYKEPVLVRDYYTKIARKLNVDIIVKNITLDDSPTFNYGWELTPKNHTYSIEKLENVCSYTPMSDIDTCIDKALKSLKENTPSNDVSLRMNCLPKPINYPIY
ncbi:NAD-dependent epimerase/dehydratase family protein [Vibrio parahaemolyticus]|nr:NAD-dependent epimerase/dehydratase family protein [Vibrio parahaemolyticus]HCG7986964.1 NAD-dependent epimerase/dehydratase family protein [Vibrio parahaemolyticus]